MTANKKVEFTTERLFLRTVDSKDAELIFNYRSDVETNKYKGWIPNTINDVEVFLSKVSTEINIPNTWYQFVIIESNKSKIIGDLGIHFIDDEQAEIGCTLAKEYHGNGYATEALKSVIDYLFNQVNKHRIIASIDPNNLNSIGLVERLGFRKEAHFKESLFLNGQWVDDIVYAILKKEWN
nr:GNAT family protein [uncultured Carboxylicivirga sp.]